MLPRACETQLDGGLPPFLLFTEQKQGENQMGLAYFQLFYEVNNFSCKLLRCILMLEKKALVDI